MVSLLWLERLIVGEVDTGLGLLIVMRVRRLYHLPGISEITTECSVALIYHHSQ